MEDKNIFSKEAEMEVRQNVFNDDSDDHDSGEMSSNEDEDVY